MRTTWSLIIALVLALLVGCEDRVFITRAQVVSNAGHLQIRDDFKWGEPIEVLDPSEPDANNKFWWQLRYHPGKDGVPRIIIVDSETGWARLPPPGYRPRMAAPPKVSSSQPLSIDEGSFILVILPDVDADQERQKEIAKEAARLNDLASNTGLTPMFSIRPTRDGRSSLIYGWHNNTGIKQSERIVEWLTVRTPYRDPVWINLASTP